MLASSHADKTISHHFEKTYSGVYRQSPLMASGFVTTGIYSATKPSAHFVAHRTGESVHRGRVVYYAIEGRLSSSVSWLKEATSTLTSLTTVELEDSPTAASCSSAQMVLERLHVANLRPSRIVGTAEAGIMFYFFAKQRMAAIECFDTGEIAFLTQMSKSTPQAWDVYAEVFPLQESVGRIADFVTVVNHEKLLAAS